MMTIESSLILEDEILTLKNAMQQPHNLALV
jgi:hypothetical protein